MLDFHHRGPAKIPVGVVTVAKGQAIDAAMTLVVDRSVIEESTDASSLVESLVIVYVMKAGEDILGRHGCR